MYRRIDWRLSHDPSVVSTTTSATTATTTPWSSASTRGLEMSDLERSSELPQDDVPSHKHAHSRRRRAWSNLRLPRMRRDKKAAAMFSISFYPWKMEARGYYSNPEAAAEWVPDTASTRCQICMAGFNLARRRHHCRLCGRLVCNACSLQRTFLPFGEDAHRRSNHAMIKSGEAQRTCNSCTKTLKNMVAQHDHRVKEFCVDVAATVPPSGNATAGRASCVGGGRVSKSERPSACGAVDTVSPELQLQLARPRAVSTTSATRNAELDQVLKARAKSRAAGSSAQQHIISSEWLEQWLQFVQMDSSDAVASGIRHSVRPSMAPRSSLGSRRRSSRLAFGHRPGPIANYTLLNFVNGKLVPRDGLRRSRGTEGSGDYRVISHEVWLVFLQLYGGGPCITMDESNAHEGRSQSEDTTSRAMVVAASNVTDGNTDTPNPLPWLITELDDAVSASQFATTGKESVEPQKHGRDRPTRVAPLDQRQLALRSSTSTTFFSFGETKSSWRRPASVSGIGIATPSPSPPLALARSTNENTGRHLRRTPSAFKGYWKKWRNGEEPAHERNSSATFSQIDDGVVLYEEPVKVTGKGPQREDCDGEFDFYGSRGPDPDQQRETIAAVSAFAAAAAEARRKSTMSLMRHSQSTAMMTRASQSSVMSA